MGNAQLHHSRRPGTTPEERRIWKKFESKFSSSEIALLSSVFRDLARRSPKSTVDPEHFDEYVSFPGLHGEQVFRVFDAKKTGNLDFEEFVSGLARSARGTEEEKVKFLFEIYDLKGDGFVWKSELQSIINHVPRSALRHDEKDPWPPKKRFGVRDHRFVDPQPATATPATTGTPPGGGGPQSASAVEARKPLLGVATHRLARAASTTTTTTTTTTTPTPLEEKKDEAQSPQSPSGLRRYLHFEDTNDDLVEEAFEKCDLNKDGKLSFDQFKLWIASAPEVLGFVDDVFERAMTAAGGGGRDSYGGGRHSPVSGMKRVSSDSGLKRASSESNLVVLPPTTQQHPESLESAAAESAAETRARSRSAVSVDSTAESESTMRTYNEPPPPPTLDVRQSSEDSWTHDQPDDEWVTRKEGTLQKIGAKMSAVTTRYFVLIGNCLYYFVKKGDARPRGLIFLGGCQVEKLKTDHHHSIHHLRHGFRIVHLDAERLGQRQHTLYASSAKERDEWVEALLSALSSPRWSRKNGAFDVTQYYDLGDELGTGRFAVARKATDRKTGAHVAVKSIEKRASLYGTIAPPSDDSPPATPDDKKDDDPEASSPLPPPPPERPQIPANWGTTMAKTERAMFRREIAVMRLARHQSILPLLAVFEDRTHVHLVMPLMQCDLATYLTRRQEEKRPCDEDDARACLPVVIEAVAYLHHLGVAHRDLKPDNILMEDVNDLSRLRLADFSISQILKPDETIHKAAGSIEYMAPEVFLKHLGAGFPADVWAMGVIAILVLFYRQPFGGDTKGETIGNILDRKICDLDWDKYSPEARDLFETKMLALDPSDRCTAQDAFENHPWCCQATGNEGCAPTMTRSLSEPAWRREPSEYA